MPRDGGDPPPNSRVRLRVGRTAVRVSRTVVRVGRTAVAANPDRDTALNGRPCGRVYLALDGKNGVTASRNDAAPNPQHRPANPYGDPANLYDDAVNPSGHPCNPQHRPANPCGGPAGRDGAA